MDGNHYFLSVSIISLRISEPTFCTGEVCVCVCGVWLYERWWKSAAVGQLHICSQNNSRSGACDWLAVCVGVYMWKEIDPPTLLCIELKTLAVERTRLLWLVKRLHIQHKKWTVCLCVPGKATCGDIFCRDHLTVSFSETLFWGPRFGLDVEIN